MGAPTDQLVRQIRREMIMWLEDTGGRVLLGARQKRGATTSSRKVSRISGQRAGLKFTITAKGNVIDAFDREIVVPKGGFRPPAGQRAWRMEKSEGTVFRSRIYTKHQGKRIQRKGFLEKAIRQELEGLQGRKNLEKLTEELLQQIIPGVLRALVTPMRGSSAIHVTTNPPV